MHTVAIVQARMTSTRLPGKVMADLSGRPMLARIVERLRVTSSVDEITVATTVNEADDIVVELADRLDVRWHRGDEHDVLGRYVGAAVESGAEAIVRITSDCPLLDSAVVDLVTRCLKSRPADFDLVCNTTVIGYPVGLAVQAVHRDTLHRIDRMACQPHDREHVLVFATATNPGLFRRHAVIADSDDSDIRLTVDYPADLDVIRQVYDALDLGQRHLPYQEVVRWLRAHPDVMRQNQHLQTWNPCNASMLMPATGEACRLES